jgi:methylsterol monooxygenase
MVGPSFGHMAASIVGLVLIQKLAMEFVLPSWIPETEAFFKVHGRAKALFIGSTISTSFVWWGVGTLMAIPAMFQLTQWKIQPNKSLEMGRLRKALPLITFNLYLGMVFSAAAFLFLLPERAWDWRQLPDTATLTRDVCIWLALEEVMFFYVHRWLHENKWMYAKVHKLHHTWTAPVSFVAIYCHPFEHIVSNIVPLLAGPILCGSHAAAVMTYTSVGLIHTLAVHSGYWFCDDNGMHDEHHAKFNVNYGITGVLDSLYGTLSLPDRLEEEKKS